MIEFRQKDFSKPKEFVETVTKKIKEHGGAKEIFRKGKDSLKKGATPITVASLGISTGNLINNSIRRDQDRVFQERQVEATNRLTKALNADTKSREVQAASKGYRKSIKDMADYSLSDTGIPDREEVRKRFNAALKPKKK